MTVNIYTHYRWSASRRAVKKPPQTLPLNPESTYSSVGHEHSSKAINTVHRFLANYPSHERFVGILCFDMTRNYCNIHLE